MNYDSNGNANFLISSGNIVSLLFQNITTTQRVEKFHYWPWSYAANLFGLVVLCSGVCCIISSYRRSYSSVFSFLTTSLFAALFSGYLIGYYTILIKYYQAHNLNDPAIRPETLDTSWGLIGTNLAFSCSSCLFAIIGFLTSFLGIRACTHKGLNDYNNIIVSSMGHHHHQRKYHRNRKQRTVSPGSISPAPPPLFPSNITYRPSRNISPPPFSSVRSPFR